MKLLKYSLIVIMTLVLTAGAGYLLASSGIKSKPGYAKLVLPDWYSADTKLSFDLGPKGIVPLRWVVNRAASSSGQKLELSEQLMLDLLQDLNGVQVHVYEVENNREIYDQAVSDSIVSLIRDDWQTVLKVHEDNERVVVMQSEEAGLIKGLSLLLTTPDNAVFVNLLGQIDPDSIVMIADSLSQK